MSSDATASGQRTIGLGDLPLGLRIGAALLIAQLFLAIAGPQLVAYGPTQMTTGIPLYGASWQHPFGLDQLGRDVFSRAIHGGGLVITLSLAGTILAFILGCLIGLVSGYRGGLFDSVAMRIVEAFISIPVLFLALLLVALAGVRATGTAYLIVAVIGVVYAPRIARIARSAAMEVAQLDFVAAAKLRGDSAIRIALREILPNVSGTLLVEFSLRAAYAPVLVASLGFLGFGLKPPTPEWGLIIAENRNLIFLTPATVLGPGFLLASLVVAVNLLTDGISRLIGRTIPLRG
jgi:peptide/nickel transport system permease protein